MPQICPSGLFILLPIYSSRPAPVLVGLKRWRQRGACLGCSGETSQRRDHVILICRFRLEEFFSPQADVAGESVLGMLLCGGRSQGLVKTSWSSHPIAKCCHTHQPRFSELGEVLELLCPWEGGEMPRPGWSLRGVSGSPVPAGRGSQQIPVT